MPTFTRVLCPVDLSETSGHAVSLAAALTATPPCQLTVRSPCMCRCSCPCRCCQCRATGSRLASSTALSRMSGRSPRPPGVGRECPWSWMWAGPTSNPEAGRRGHGRRDRDGHPRRRWVLTPRPVGWVTEKVLRQAPCPVLAVPPGARASSAVPFRQVVCAVDFSDWSVAALDLAASLAHETGATLTAVHAIEWPWREPPAPTLTDLPPEQAAALLRVSAGSTSERAVARLRDVVRDVVAGRCETSTGIVHGKSHIELVRVASARQADLIVMGVHGRSAIDLAVFGSTTNQVVRHATCPVLIVRR